MRKLTDFIINKRHFILILFIILTIISAILSTKVKINYDIAEYLPDNSETRIGMDIMEKEFSGTETSTLNLMFENLPETEKQEVKTSLENLEDVESVEYDSTENYNKDNYTLYVITVDDASDSETATNVYNQITEKYKDYTTYTSGNISQANKSVLPTWIIVLAVACALVILLIMCESYTEPFLFLASILMAVVLNKGTNIIFNNVSHITVSIVAILQMALSMDYSIMLMNRYDQEKQTEKDNVKAMKDALYKAFQAISSSSVTTIVGLLALVFMTFKIGKDLGFVLAKGVLFSLICIFFVLPDLILMFDKWIAKTKKKTPNIKLTNLGKFSYKIRYISVPLFLIVFITSFLLKGNLGIDYTDSQTDDVSNIFTENNQIAIIYKNEDEQKIAKCLASLENEQKVDEVLGYGNTINESLTYDKLKEKLKDLGSDVDIEDYLLKIIYYDYYNKGQKNTVTFEDFINFIEDEAYINEKTNEKIDNGIKEDISRLKNFVTESAMNEKKTSSEISKILDIDKQNIDDIFTYYLSKHNTIKLTLKDFINFMNTDVLTNEKYSSKINNESKNQLNTLSKFANKQTLQTKMTSDEIAKLFGISSNMAEDLYQYYCLVNSDSVKMTISEFANFVLTDMLNNSEYSKEFDEQTIQSIKMLAAFSNLQTIKSQMSIKELSNLFGIKEETVKQILLLKYSQLSSASKFSLTEFINNVLLIDGIPDISKLESVAVFAQNKGNINSTQLSKQTLKQLFSGVNANMVDAVYLLTGLPDSKTFTPQEFVNLVLNNQSSIPLDSNSLNNLQLLKMIIDDSLSDNKIKYSDEQMSKILSIDLAQMHQLYALIDYSTNNVTQWKSTPEEFVKIILNNAEIKNTLDKTTLSNLQLLSVIISNTIDNKNFTYQELSQTIGINIDNVKKIYTVYTFSKNSIKLTPKEFVDFVLSHKNDSMIAKQITSKTIKDLNLVNSVIDGVMNNKKYSSAELSSLLGIGQDNLDLLYGLYSIKYINTTPSLSLREFISFILNDVITNAEYADKFDNDKILKLNTVDGIMTNSLKGVKYTSDEILAIINNLSDEVEKNTVEVLYTYYGSDKEFDDTWKMTVEQFVKFLNEDILQDERFTEFIDNDMRNNITEAKTTVSDAKELLVGNEYSRVVLNTKLAPESKETFDFIQKLKDMFAEYSNKVYVVGDSTMAYEISQTFDNELNFMTIITMIAIFIVVAITFKSVIIPTILVLIIQTAVYLTMGILSIIGENVYFIAILIVQSILMGATIDYAILYTSYYLEHRKSEGIKEAIIDSYNRSIHTILTSSSILIIVTLIIANFASAIAAKICKTISEGTICSTILILTLLPAVLAFCDKFIIKNKK